MTSAQKAWLRELLASVFRPKPKESVSAYCEEHLFFNEPECQGRFSLTGREYLREPVDNWKPGNGVHDQMFCAGTRTGKTRLNFAGLAWSIIHRLVRALYVMAKAKGTAGAEDQSRTRFIPMLEATPVIAARIPRGTRRYQFKTLQQIIGGSIIDWTGSNSVAALASNPCQIVIQDETDKFNTLRKRDEQGNPVEADAVTNADERTKEAHDAKRFKSCTPTLPSGITWQELKKSDLRRYFLPCPHCNPKAEKPVADFNPTAKDSTGWLVLAWSSNFTVLPKTGCEAYARWDKDAKSDVWDYDRVKASAHFQCPHCKGKILDTHKAEMIRGGCWRPTQKGAPGYRGYHLPSMYAAHPSCNVGEMAVKFLKACRSLTGVQGFINSDLAEPYMAQDQSAERTEHISRIEVTDEWRKQLTIDCQAKAPYFWVVARAWSENKSHGLLACSCDSWQEIESIQAAQGVLNPFVMVDSGFGSKDDAEVYRTCAGHCEFQDDAQGDKAYAFGWMPAKGMPSYRRWQDSETGLMLPYRLQRIDPFIGTDRAGLVRMDLFEFAADFFKDILASMRAGKGGCRWSVEKSVATDLYWRHMDGQKKFEEMRNGQARLVWKKRHRYWPDHLYACEVMQIAQATFNSLLSLDEKPKKKKEKE